MSVQPNRGNQARHARLNFREFYPIPSPQHPEPLRQLPSDAIGVLWLDSEGTGSYPRFAYLNASRAAHLYLQLQAVLAAHARPKGESDA